MHREKSIEIVCSACGRDALLVREPLYEGFTRTGESLTCSACGYHYASEEEVVYKHAARLDVFSDADRPAAVALFQEVEKERFCRYCRHYVVNPFTQWCHVHRKEVEATDVCGRFERQEEPQQEA